MHGYMQENSHTHKINKSSFKKSYEHSTEHELRSVNEARLAQRGGRDRQEEKEHSDPEEEQRQRSEVRENTVKTEAGFQISG